MTSAGKVLVAHGNTKRLRGAVDLMRDLGFEVIATPDGGDAFARFFEEEPAVVLCSAQLPGLSGVSFAAMVQSQAPGTLVAILVDPDEPADLSGAVGVATITEPLTVDALRAALPALPVPSRSAVADTASTSSSSGVFALAALKRFQRDNTLLSVVDENGLGRIAALAVHELRMSDEQIITEGDPGTGFYLVVEGQVRVTLAEKNNQEIARIGAGGFFGEMAMLSDRKRSASVWTVGPTTLLYFAREQFLPLLDDYPTLREVLSGVALKRTEENLWRTLFEDDDVQRSIGSLSEPSTPITSLPAPPPVATWNQQTPPGGVKLSKPGPDVDALLRERDAREAALRGVHAVELTEARRGGVRIGGLVGAALGVAIGVAVGFVLATRSPSLVDETVAVAPERVIAPRAAEPALTPEPTPEPTPPMPAAPPPLEEPPQAPPAPIPEAPAAGEPALATSAVADPEMKRLRRELMSAERGGNHTRAITAGLALETAGGLDWEAGFFLARAQQQGGQATQALTRYTDFIAAYPRNDYADEAYFYSGEILQARGRKQEAIVAFQNVVTRPKSSLIEQAKAKLAALGAPVP